MKKNESRQSRRVNFLEPTGEKALIAPDSVSWRVFKNPVAAFIGGITAVILELAEERVAAGVWNHTTFRTDPRTRLRRTGLAAMVTVYGPQSTAESMIAGVRKAHDKVRGTTESGQPYHANDPDLLDWVQATASYGFVEAYSHYVKTLSSAEIDAFYRESVVPSRLYGTQKHPDSRAAQEEQFALMKPHLRATPIVDEFLEIMQTAVVLPRALRPLQQVFVRAAVELLPEWALEQLEISAHWRMRAGERAVVKAAAYLADRIVIKHSPAVQACRRVGLPETYLYPPSLFRFIRI